MGSWRRRASPLSQDTVGLEGGLWGRSSGLVAVVIHAQDLYVAAQHHMPSQLMRLGQEKPYWSTNRERAALACWHTQRAAGPQELVTAGLADERVH